MKEKKVSFAYKILRFFVRAVYKKVDFEGTQNVPAEPSIIVGNHTQTNGPIIFELYSPVDTYTWCAGDMMKLRDVPAYAYKDFWSQKSAVLKPIFKIVSYLIAPIAVCVFNNARTIGVYRDKRILHTFKDTVNRLNEGNHVVIFPEKDEHYNNILYEFQEGFVDVARLYFKRTGKEIDFVPVYIAPNLKKAVFGNPIRFNSGNDIENERKRICDYLKTEITNLAAALPRHKVVPYRNIKKKDYPYNID